MKLQASAAAGSENISGVCSIDHMIGIQAAILSNKEKSGREIRQRSYHTDCDTLGNIIIIGSL